MRESSFRFLLVLIQSHYQNDFLVGQCQIGPSLINIWLLRWTPREVRFIQLLSRQKKQRSTCHRIFTLGQVAQTIHNTLQHRSTSVVLLQLLQKKNPSSSRKYPPHHSTHKRHTSS